MLNGFLPFDKSSVNKANLVDVLESLIHENASESKIIDFFNAILANRDNLNCKDVLRNNFLHILIANGQKLTSLPQLIQVLINQGINVNAKNLWGDTPLHEVAATGNLEIARILLDAHGNQHIKNRANKTPFDKALVTQNQKMVTLLRKTTIFFSKHEPLKKQIAAQKIQKIVRLKLLWKSFLKNPDIYKDFSDDNIANNMFGMHVARIKKENKNVNMEYITNSKEVVTYYREGNSEEQKFKAFPMDSTFTNIPVAFLGTGKSRWEKNIQKFLSNKNRQSHTKKIYANKILNNFASDFSALIRSKEFNKLKAISRRNKSPFSLHAEEICNIMEWLYKCDKLKDLDKRNLLEFDIKRIQSNIARMHMFLSMLVYLHNNSHTKFATLMEPLLHEISLLMLEIKHMSVTNEIIHLQEFSRSVNDEFLYSPGTFGVEEKHLSHLVVMGFPANSGMYAHSLSLILAQNILGIKPQNKKNFSFTVYKESEHYFETKQPIRGLLKIKEVNDIKSNPDIYLINASILDGFSPYSGGTNVNHLLEELLRTVNIKKHTVLVIDITTTDYAQLRLSALVQNLLSKQLLTLIFWESWQKFGLLGTDQIQFGRIIVLTHKVNVPKLAESINAAKEDNKLFDMQMGSLFQICRKQHHKYRQLHFQNGEILRSSLNQNIKDGFDKVGPFLSDQYLYTTLAIFENFGIQERDSFGFNNITITGKRISASCEPNIDIKIFGLYLKKLTTYTSSFLDSKNPRELTRFLRTPVELNQSKIESLRLLIIDINHYFSSIKIDNLLYAPNDKIIEFISYFLLAQCAMSHSKILSLKSELDVSNIFNSCKYFLKLDTSDEAYKLFKNNLELSNKFIEIIVDVYSKSRSFLHNNIPTFQKINK